MGCSKFAEDCQLIEVEKNSFQYFVDVNMVNIDNMMGCKASISLAASTVGSQSMANCSDNRRFQGCMNQM